MKTIIKIIISTISFFLIIYIISVFFDLMLADKIVVWLAFSLPIFIGAIIMILNVLLWSYWE